jgi:hypothetical protein
VFLKPGHPMLLVLVLLVHLFALFMLVRHHVLVQPPIVAGAQRITYLQFIPPRARATPPPSPQQRAAPVAPRSRAVPAPVASVPTASAAPATEAPAAPASTPSRHGLTGAEILEQARRDMPRIERELRKGVPTKLTLSTDSLQYKLQHGIEDAYVGGDQRTVVDFYTSPDNVHYMRITKAGKVWCTMNGGPVSLRSAMGGGGTDTTVNCPPPDAGWKDMPWVN